MTDRPLCGLLGICKRAGRLTVGFDAVKALVKLHPSALVMLAADVSPKTKKETLFFLSDLATPASPLTLPLTKAEIQTALGAEKPIGVLSTEDKGFAAALLNACRQLKEVDVT